MAQARRRTSFPGLPQAATNELIGMQDGLMQDDASLRLEAIGSTTDTKTSAYSAKFNEAIRVQFPTSGDALTFPSAGTATVDKWIEVLVLGGGPIKVQATGGSVNGLSSVSLTTAGRYMFRSDGQSSWWLAGPPTAGSIPLTALAPQGANTVVANPTAGLASPVAFPVGANTVLGRAGGNLTAAQLVAAQVTLASLTNALLATMTANTVKANATAGVASPGDVGVNAEAVFGRTSGNLQSIDSAVQTALIRAAGSVFWAAAAANQVLRRSGAGDLGFGTLVDGNLSANTITGASQTQMAANTLKGNPTAALANESDLAVGANAVVGRVGGNIVAAQLVAAQVTANGLGYAQLNQPAANTMPGNPTAGVANLQDIALAAQSILLRASGNIVNSACAADQVLGRVGSGDLGFGPTPRLLRAPQVLTTGTTISHPTGTRVLFVRGVGGGGAGGGANAAAGALGGQGASGTYGEKTFIAPASSSTYAIGAAGVGVAGAAGGNGGSSTFTNGVTVTLPGGGGGGVAAGTAAATAAAAGGAAAGAATNADWSVRGQPGSDVIKPQIATTPCYHLGPAGSNPLGTGSPSKVTFTTVVAGAVGAGFGSGGGGVLQGTTAVASAGANGATGAWIVEEWG